MPGVRDDSESEISVCFPGKSNIFDDFVLFGHELSMTDEQICKICGDGTGIDEQCVVITLKGLNGVIRASEQRNDDRNFNVGDKVHTACRKAYCRQSSIKAHKRRSCVSEDVPKPKIPNLRSSVSFDFQSRCIFCGQIACRDDVRTQVFPVRTYDFEAAIREAAARRMDEWSDEVLGRIEAEHADLNAADAVYHQPCSVNFRTGKNKPLEDQGKGQKRGRKSDESRSLAFDLTMEFFEENDDEKLTIQDLREEMRRQLVRQNCEDDEPYGHTYFLNKMQQRYGENIVITTIHRQPTIATLKWTLPTILNQLYVSLKFYHLGIARINLLSSLS